jgi:hypothetical protein
MWKVDSKEVEIAKPFIVVEIIEYIPNSIGIKTIITKSTCKITAVSCDAGEVMTDKIITVDTLV